MNMKKLLDEEPDEFVRTIKTAAEGRYRNLHGGDLEQIFWVGVLEAVLRMKPHSEKTNQIHYLLTCGFGKVKTYRRSEWNYRLVNWCLECKRWVGFSSPHIHPVITFPKADEYVESKHVDDFEKRVDLQIMLQEFVRLLGGNERYVAKRFLLDRIDLVDAHPIELVAGELGCHRTRVSQYRSRIKRKLRSWLTGGDFGSNGKDKERQ